MRRRPALTWDEVKEIDQKYRARLRSLITVDGAVESYVHALWRAWELGNTYVFYFTDNGWRMGNHALHSGKNTPYTEDVESPLVVRGPHVAQNTRSYRLVSNTDLAPTFAEIANASPTSSVDDRSILPLMRSQDVPWRDALLVESKNPYPWPRGWPAYKAVRTSTYAFHFYPETGEEKLYDLDADPYQLQSVHDDPDYAEVKSTLKSKLAALKRSRTARVRRAKPLRMEGSRHVGNFREFASTICRPAYTLAHLARD